MFYLFLVFVSVLYASLCEYLLHRWVMHRPILGFTYAFNAHAKVHHRMFGFDDSYHCHDKSVAHLIRMAWWNGPILIIVASIPPAVLSYYVGDWRIVVVSATVTACYYGAYEYMHWCMHLPRPRRRLVEKLNIFGFHLFRYLNGHHILHHRYMGKNLNVVCPFADFVFGTLVLRSRVPFLQPRGLDVPDVQPHHAR